MGKWGMSVGVVVAVGSMLGFAYWAGPGRAPSDCPQPPWRVSAAVVEQGGSVTVTGDDATTCDPRYGARAEIDISITSATSGTLATVQAPMASRGAFTVEVIVPDEAAPGPYEVSAIPSGIDTCRDSNADAACAAPPTVPLEVIGRDAG